MFMPQTWVRSWLLSSPELALWGHPQVPPRPMGCPPPGGHGTSGALHSPRAAPCSGRDGAGMETPRSEHPAAAGTRRGHKGVTMGSSPGSALHQGHIPAPAPPHGASSSPGAGGRSRGAPCPGSSSLGGTARGPATSPAAQSTACQELSLPGLAAPQCSHTIFTPRLP